jgi:N-sulfoglucosamine sulfohydrolase
MAHYFQLCFGKRPAEELYDLRADPGQTNNLAGQTNYAEAQKQLRDALDRWMAETGDPRVKPEDERWDKFPYYGNTKYAPAAVQHAKQ